MTAETEEYAEVVAVADSIWSVPHLGRSIRLVIVILKDAEYLVQLAGDENRAHQ
jgi:hypothetical protein